MLNRTTPRRLTFIVLALILGILLGLALFPSGDLAGAEQAVDCTPVTEISEAECLALKELFDTTDGANWSNNSGWQDTDTPCSTWHGITCIGGSVSAVLLPSNNLSGTIPSELAQLTNLGRLNLATNELTGTIPVELGTLTQLRDLSFGYNNLTGTIPVELANINSLQFLELVSNTLEGPIPSQLGNLDNLDWLDLSSNALTGTIPATLGDPVNLASLYVNSNQLRGDVPNQLCNNLFELKLGYNKLETVNVDDCVNGIAADALDWKTTQTLPPTDLVASSPAPGEVALVWTPVTALVDNGYYEVLYSQTSGGPYTVHGQTADKSTSSYTINNLDPNTELFFVVRTVTPAHTNNQSDVVSDNGNEAPTTPNAIALADFKVNQLLPSFWPAAAITLIFLSIGAIFVVIKRA